MARTTDIHGTTRVPVVPTLAYDVTPQGVMVQVHFAQPDKAEWSSMMHYMVENSERVRAVLVLTDGEGSPTATQRVQLRETLSAMRPKLQAAILTNNAAQRAILTAMLWMTGRYEETALFAVDDVAKALAFLKLDGPEQNAVYELLSRLRKASSAVRKPGRALTH